MNAIPSFPSGLPFRRDFVWGVATSAYQIEGSAALDGKGPPIWDSFCRVPGAIADGSNGDTACDHYHRWEQDLDLIRDLGVDADRFSVSWPRVQPDGAGAWNPQGLAFYERLVDGLLARGIKPYLTLNHWDLPDALQARGGWEARDTVHRFVDYATQQRTLKDSAHWYRDFLLAQKATRAAGAPLVAHGLQAPLIES